MLKQHVKHGLTYAALDRYCRCERAGLRSFRFQRTAGICGQHADYQKRQQRNRKKWKEILRYNGNEA